MAPPLEVRVLEDPVEAAAELIADTARDGGHIALSGGSAPGPAYERAAALEPNWSRAEIWFGDDRAVAPDDERSNYLLVERHLLSRLESQPAAVHRMRGELGAEQAAAEYERELGDLALGLALNGIGPDGHTASLFPSSPGLGEESRRVIAAEPGFEPFVERVTLTPPAFARVGVLVYLVVGAKKAEPARRAFAEAPDPRTPASLIRGRKTIVLLDAAAAAELH